MTKKKSVKQQSPQGNAGQQQTAKEGGKEEQFFLSGGHGEPAGRKWARMRKAAVYRARRHQAMPLRP
ncbi:hypothetical protein FEE59_14675 [Herbaspirillum sp. RU 5E]|nr:hypothetical protein [Herbaspirillum sp. RU 5E]